MVWQFHASCFDRQALALLASRDARDRRQGAWLAATEYAPRAVRRITALVGGEADADVRESYIYALGRSGDTQNFDLIADAIRNDASPYVRHAAWVAAARLDPGRFCTLASEPAAADPWDEIGRAYAWLEVGDVRGVSAVLRWSLDGTRDQRHVACVVLYRRVAPLLEAVGRWPLAYPVTEGDFWSAELVDVVTQRIATVDLQRIADERERHAGSMAAVRRSAGKLTKARERLAWFLVRL